MAQNLTDLTARTNTAVTDIIHVNSSGIDYKQTKQNFLLGEFKHSFANDTDLTTQVNNLPTAGTYFGACSSNGHKDEVNIPVNSSILVCARVFSSQFAEIEIHIIGQGDNRYVKAKNNGTWDSSWTKLATRSEQDYKVVYKEFDKNSSLTDQIDALTPGMVYMGKLLNSTIATTGTPADTSFYVIAFVSSATYAKITLIKYAQDGNVYYKSKISSTWQSDWVNPTVKTYTQSSGSNYTISSNNSVQVTRPTALVGKDVISMTAYTWTSNSADFSLMPYNSGNKDKDYLVGKSGTTVNGLRITYFYI